MGNVNKDYVLGVVQKNNRLEIVRENIMSSSLVLNELREMISNDNKTVMDMQNHFNLKVKTIQNIFYYVLPYEYGSSYISGVEKPMISFNVYQKILNERISGLSTDTYEEKKKIADMDIKRERYEAYDRFLQCYNYFLACNRIVNNYDLKMISSESIGWTSYKYPIDNDFIVYVSTNFGYGWASYFNITVKYKDIIIAPYTYLIKYYKANMVQICNCTRAYYVFRSNWEVAFEFVIDFVNHGKEDPTSFAKKYIMNEVRELVNGLERIMKSPVSDIQNKISDISNCSDDYRRLTCISDMPDQDRQYYELNHSEFGVVYKSEKISCGLDILNSLKSLLPILPEVEASIDKIKSLNHLLIPEITALSTSIGKEIDALNCEIDKYDCKISEVEKEKAPYDKQLYEEWEKVRKNNPSKYLWDYTTEFRNSHPEYSNLINRLSELNSKKDELEDKKYKREAIKLRLDACLKKINDFFVNAA